MEINKHSKYITFETPVAIEHLYPKGRRVDLNCRLLSTPLYRSKPSPAVDADVIY
jgi:hypothetical protein